MSIGLTCWRSNDLKNTYENQYLYIWFYKILKIISLLPIIKYTHTSIFYIRGSISVVKYTMRCMDVYKALLLALGEYVIACPSVFVL